MDAHRYKVLDKNGRSPSVGGSPGFHYPHNKWTEPVENPRACQRGYHLTDLMGTLGYMDDDHRTIYEFVSKGKTHSESNKTAYESVRRVRKVGVLTDKILRMFAADCAEDALQHADPDSVPTLECAIYYARCYAHGMCDDKQLIAADSAAYYAAYYAAYSAARSAADSAAYSAACYAAYSAARERQAKMLLALLS